jgi:hypothetical protein
MIPNNQDYALRGFTLLITLEFSTDLDSGNCKLVLTLSEDRKTDARVLRAEFSDVSSLCIKDFGGGITQLLLLVIEDVHDRQLDRIRYQIRELERDALFFCCTAFTIAEITDHDH